MQVLKVDDPRDNLSKASRYELCQVAEAHGVTEIHYSSNLRLDEMVTILRERGIKDIKLSGRQIGSPIPNVIGTQYPPLKSGVPMHAVEQPHENDFNADHTVGVDKPIADMNMTEMRKACKRLGIKMERTDNLRTLRSKLESHSA